MRVHFYCKHQMMIKTLNKILSVWNWAPAAEAQTWGFVRTERWTDLRTEWSDGAQEFTESSQLASVSLSPAQSESGNRHHHNHWFITSALKSTNMHVFLMNRNWNNISITGALYGHPDTDCEPNNRRMKTSAWTTLTSEHLISCFPSQISKDS